MSEEFEVRGPHEDAIEEAEERGASDPFSGRIAITTALLATLGALFSYMAGATQADAALFKNDAAIKTTLASDQWNYYQAKGNKQNLAELGRTVAPAPAQDKFAADVERYGAEKEEIKKKAEALEEQAREFDERSEHVMHIHHRWAQAMTLLQIAIAMAAIALLTRRTWLQYVIYTFAAGGCVLGLMAFTQGAV
jgi:hypothetical protein